MQRKKCVIVTQIQRDMNCFIGLFDCLFVCLPVCLSSVLLPSSFVVWLSSCIRRRFYFIFVESGCLLVFRRIGEYISLDLFLSTVFVSCLSVRHMSSADVQEKGENSNLLQGERSRTRRTRTRTTTTTTTMTTTTTTTTERNSQHIFVCLNPC